MQHDAKSGHDFLQLKVVSEVGDQGPVYSNILSYKYRPTFHLEDCPLLVLCFLDLFSLIANSNLNSAVKIFCNQKVKQREKRKIALELSVRFWYRTYKVAQDEAAIQ